MFHRIKSIVPMEDYNLQIVFQDNTVKKYDIKPLFEIWEAFEALRSIPGLYQQVKVDTGGYGISWNDEIDLACNELWEHGVCE